MRATRQHPAFGAGQLDVAHHLVVLRLRHDGAEAGGRFHRVAHHPLLRFGHERLEELVVHLALHQDARPGDAQLPGVAEDAGGNRGHALGHVGVGEHEHRRLATQLERGALQLRRHPGSDVAGGGRRTGERHADDIGVLDQRCAGLLPEPEHCVVGAGGKARLGEDLTEHTDRQR